MKIMNWVLATTLVLPGFNASAENSSHGASDNASVNIDTNRLFPNYRTNVGHIKGALTEKRASLDKTHKKLSVRDKGFTDINKHYPMLNLQTGMTFWEEYQTVVAGDTSPISDKYSKLNLGVTIGKKIKPELLIFMTWMRANGVATFKSLMDNDSDGILAIEALKIKNLPYKADGKKTYVITKYADVVKALSEPETFSVRNYHTRMKNSVGNYMLGNDKQDINEEHKWMRKLIDGGLDGKQLQAEMEGRIRPLVKKILQDELKSQEYIKTNPKTGKLEANIELVNQIARRVPAILTIKYFGFESISPEKIMEWSRATQDDFFHNVTGKEDKAKKAVDAGQEMQKILATLVNKKFAEVESLSSTPNNERTILDRMVVDIGALNESMSAIELLEKTKDKLFLSEKDGEDLNQLSAKEIVRRIKSRVVTNLIGTLVGGIETTQAAISQSLNLFFQDANLLKKAKELSQAAKSDKYSSYYFSNLIWEVLRFHPVNPIVFRFIEKDTHIGGVEMKANSHIMIATQAAMFDESVFSKPMELNLARFQPGNPANDKYFHLGYGHHRCLGDYVSMIQVPEIIAGILELPNVRPMEGQFGELDFRKRADKFSLSESTDSSFPERMMLTYDSSEARPLIKREIEIADKKIPFEAYLNDFDRNSYRGCLSGWKIVKDTKGEYVYSQDGNIHPANYSILPRFKANEKDFVSSGAYTKRIKTADENKSVSALAKKTNLIRSWLKGGQGYLMSFKEQHADMLYCRLPLKFHVCFEKESQESPDVGRSWIKLAGGNKQIEIRQLNEMGKKEAVVAHQKIFNSCAVIAGLTPLERQFYEHQYFDKTLPSQLSLDQSKRPDIFEKDYALDDYFSAHERFFHRGSYTNIASWKMTAPQINFYTRLNFTFRSCFGKKVLIGREDRCKAYHSCKNGNYIKDTFKYEGALSTIEKEYYNQLMNKCEKL